jgi:hypothetical protein
MKRRIQQFFYCLVRIRCLGNVFTEPFPNNDWGKGINRHTHSKFISKSSLKVELVQKFSIGCALGGVRSALIRVQITHWLD